MKSYSIDSPRAIGHGKKLATRRMQEVLGSSPDEAAKSYDAIRSLCHNHCTMVDLSPDHFSKFMQDGVWADEEDPSYNARKSRLLSIMGAKTNPVRCRCSLSLSAGPSGKYSVVFQGRGDVVVARGTFGKAFEAGEDMESDDPRDSMYDVADAADCLASAAILEMPRADMLGGIGPMLEKVGKSATSCEALAFGQFLARSVIEVGTRSSEDANRVRELLGSMAKMVPVLVGDSVDDTMADIKSIPIRAAEHLHFQVSDRVGFKPSLNNPSLSGTITGVSDGSVSVQWDNGERHMYDVAEALARLATMSEKEDIGDFPVMAYSLPWMDEETVWSLDACGIDPVTVCGVVSHAMPASGQDWMSPVAEHLRGIGLKSSIAKGFKETYSGFAPREWVEAVLPENARMIIDRDGYGFRIRAGGEVDDYVVPRHLPIPVAE